ncbi:protein FAM83A-like [Xyrichtys novacula]|uniref:Protein FAM83A-like n=1 Tax=Xyrichtys novacula TaxID=13765 RepID=A0AAV1FM02_XYRNO|nr:protein FAM83A-like [Xyrichtys novacula]
MQAVDLSPVGSGGASALWHRRSKPLGKVKRRVQDLRTPTPSYIKVTANEPRPDLSHNEAARLAMDSLLNEGMEGYKEVLSAEGEVDFLSKLEKTYIMENGMDNSTAEPDASADKEPESSSAGSHTTSQRPTLSTQSELTVADMNPSRQRGVTKSDPTLGGFRIYFQCDSRACGMKDVVRELIRKAETVLAIAIDSFSDMELLFDLLEASRRRNVSVYLLLDHLNVNVFVSMWQNLKLESKNFPKISVRSVGGETYCAKTGHKLTGQMAESFVIADWREVLTGSFSFSWLSWHVYRSLVVLLKGRMAESFHQEFLRLYASSEPVPGFVDCMSLTCERTLYTAVQSTQDSKAAAKTMDQDDMITDAYEMEMQLQEAELAKMRSLELERSKSDTQPPQKTETGAQVPEKPAQTDAEPQTQELQSAPVEKPENTGGDVCTPCAAETNVEPEEEQEQNKKQEANAQPQPNSCTVTTEDDSDVKTEDSNPQQTAESQSQDTLKQSSPKPTLNINLQNVDTEGVSSQQKNRERLTSPSSGIPSGLNTQRRHWMTQEFKPNMDFVPDHSKPLSPGTGKTWFSQPQQAMPSTRLNWMPQNHRPAARQNSFESVYRTGQNTMAQMGWRPFHTMYSGLQRSRSINEKGY